MSWKTELGDQIRDARSKSGLTQVQLAEKLSVTRVQLGNYEKGRSAIPVNILTEIAEALHVASFTVGGYRVVPEKDHPKPIPAPDLQLPMKFKDEQLFSDASLKIDSANSLGEVVITAVFKHPRSA